MKLHEIIDGIFELGSKRDLSEVYDAYRLKVHQLREQSVLDLKRTLRIGQSVKFKKRNGTIIECVVERVNRTTFQSTLENGLQYRIPISGIVT